MLLHDSHSNAPPGLVHEVSDLLELARADQASLSAVERFSEQHAEGDIPDQERFYRTLLPARRPGEGEQYAFSVDLDECTGCKSCVSACHSLNGLGAGETWRQVGLLVGGNEAAPFQQTVTGACHHCVDPACMNGCPVNAYEKDPVTGIVRHLDDQCIGCQYCILKCPYGAPQYNERLGIVRKCDMCSDRLSVGEAPACVQACPNEAIEITIVHTDQVVSDSQADTFLPGAAAPDYTLPTTVYKSERALPRNLLPADFFAIRAEHAHMPLVVMLVLTQLSVGALGLHWLLGRGAAAGVTVELGAFHSAVALGLGLLALGASTLHLGRPQYAYRAVLGVFTSWMSREILAFSAFAGLAALYAASYWAPIMLQWLGQPVPAALTDRALRDVIGAGAVVTGVFGVVCSVLIYSDTRRELWRGSRTVFRFFSTSVILGSATIIASSLAAALWLGLAASQEIGDIGRRLGVLLIVVTTLELAVDVSIFRHRFARRHTALKRTALLMGGELKRITSGRFGLGLLGGIVLPGIVLASSASRDGEAGATLVVALVSLALLVAAELCERHLFFSAVVAPKMPGAPVS